MEEERIYYESSDGKLTPIDQVDTTHLINSLAKQHRDIYNSQTKDEFDKYYRKMAMIDNELTKRLGNFIKEKWSK